MENRSSLALAYLSSATISGFVLVIEDEDALEKADKLLYLICFKRGYDLRCHSIAFCEI